MRVLTELFINGRWRASHGSTTISVVNPATEEEIGTTPAATAEDVGDAVRAASEAFPAWRKTSLSERLDMLESWQLALEARAEGLAETITGEVGTPVSLCRDLQVEQGLIALKSSIETARDFTLQERADGMLLTHDPVGVVAVITPWNYPIVLALMKIAPALAAGCTVVFKVPEQTPLHAFELAESAREADLPAGVFNVVPGFGAEAGEALAGHPDVAMVSFTGSTAVGKRVHELASRNLTHVNLELGGKSAAILLPDADLDASLRACLTFVFMNSGQSCGAWSRILVPTSKLAEATDIAVSVAEEWKVGDPLAADTMLGPVVSRRQHDRVTGYIRAGESDGGTIVTGGADSPAELDRGFFVRPTIFTGVENSMRIAQEEIFGPVAMLLPYKDESDAIRLANESNYGLHAGVFSSDPGRAETVAKELQVGQVYINGLKMNPAAPFGGCKDSGIGRTGGPIGLSEFFQVKAILS